MELTKRIKSKRLFLRPYLDGDEKDFLLMLKDNNREHLDELLGQIAQSNSEDEIKDFIKSLSNDWEQNERFVLSFWDLQSKVYYGHIWIEPVDTSIFNYEIGWFINKNYQSKGFVTEAAIEALKFLFNDLKANKVVARVRDHGIYKKKSINIIKRCNFKLEGFLRNSVKVITSNGSGPIVGEHYFGLLRDEYFDC